jgi:hypothetical protein
MSGVQPTAAPAYQSREDTNHHVAEPTYSYPEQNQPAPPRQPQQPYSQEDELCMQSSDAGICRDFSE